MVELSGSENIRGCRLSPRYQRYADKCIRLYFKSLPKVIVYTAPLLNITKASQKAAIEKPESWVDAGEYGIAGLDFEGNSSIILDKGTSVFHSSFTKITVIHELIHFAIGLDKGHGKQFKAQVRRIAALGALDDLI